MGAFNTAVVTVKGQALLAKTIAGTCKMNFSRMALSDAKLTGDISVLTSLSGIKQTELISHVGVEDEKSAVCEVAFSNAGLNTGYYVRNIGLYAIDPDEGEILYSISTADETLAGADWMPPISRGVISLLISVVTVLSSSASVDVNVDPTAYVTVSQFTTHTDNKENPHNVTPHQIGMFDYVGGFVTSVVDWDAVDGEYLSPYKLKCSEGLAFEDIDDNTCAVAGKGDCNDIDIVIPMYSPEGKMVTEIKSRAFEGYHGLRTLVVSKTVLKINSYALDSDTLKTLVLTNPDTQTSARKTTAKLERIIYNGSPQAFKNSYLADQLVSEGTKVLYSLVDTDSFCTKEELDEALKNPSYEEDVSLVGITTEVGDIGATITDNAVGGAGNLFHVNITGHIKFHCEVDKSGGWATVMGVELGGDTGVYEYSFEGVVEDGFEVYCSFAGVTFTKFVKKVPIKDTIGDMDKALDELHNYAQALIGGEA